MITRFSFLVTIIWLNYAECRDEDKIMKACFWPNEVYEPCFGGCAEVSCDNPRNHLRPCYPYCEPGCICEDPYVRDDRSHQCVLPQDCSPTQMGIPVPTKKSDKVQPGSQLPAASKFLSRTGSRSHNNREEPFSDFQEPDILQAAPSPLSAPSSVKIDEFKRPAEVSRMGNYFNIVIAPPPIKALRPRKMLQSNTFSMSKRY